MAYSRVSDPPTMDEFVHALATAGLAEAVRLLDVGCRAGSDVEVTASLPQSCSVAVAAHGCVQCRVGCPAAWRAAMGDGDTWPLVIPMPHSLRRAGMATPVLRMLVACVAPGAGLAPRAQTSTPSSCCGKQPGGWASTTLRTQCRRWPCRRCFSRHHRRRSHRRARRLACDTQRGAERTPPTGWVWWTRQTATRGCAYPSACWAGRERPGCSRWPGFLACPPSSSVVSGRRPPGRRRSHIAGM